MVSGKIESSEMHEVRVIFSWNSSDRSVKHLLPSGCRAARDSSKKRSYKTGQPAVFSSGPPAPLCR